MPRLAFGGFRARDPSAEGAFYDSGGFLAPSKWRGPAKKWGLRFLARTSGAEGAVVFNAAPLPGGNGCGIRVQLEQPTPTRPRQRARGQQRRLGLQTTGADFRLAKGRCCRDGAAGGHSLHNRPRRAPDRPAGAEKCHQHDPPCRLSGIHRGARFRSGAVPQGVNAVRKPSLYPPRNCPGRETVYRSTVSFRVCTASEVTRRYT